MFLVFLRLFRRFPSLKLKKIQTLAKIHVFLIQKFECSQRKRLNTSKKSKSDRHYELFSVIVGQNFYQILGQSFDRKYDSQFCLTFLRHFGKTERNSKEYMNRIKKGRGLLFCCHNLIELGSFKVASYGLLFISSRKCPRKASEMFQQGQTNFQQIPKSTGLGSVGGM